MKPRLVITGPTGTGKSTVAPLVAAQLKLPVIDLDAVIEERAGISISEIFARDGEAQFRRLERDAVSEAAAMSEVVIATGGGTVMESASFSGLARDALVVVLVCSASEAARRLRDTAATRPLLAGDEAELASRIEGIHALRSARHTAVGTALDTTGLTPAEVADEIVSRYQVYAASHVLSTTTP